jgi:uncharacterized membrane protein
VDLVDFIGQGICHREPARVLHPDAWLCGRCTALYAAALVGAALSGAFGRRLRLAWQIALGALLVAPVCLEKVLIEQGSPLDTMALRLVTGALGGLGVALVVGARGAGAVRWPQAPWAAGRVPPGWVLALASVAVGVLALVLGAPAPLDLVAFAGVVALAVAGTAWGLDVAAAIALRLRGRPAAAGRPKWGLLLLLAFASAELVLLAAVPSSWRPGFAWVAPLFTRPF